jgi:hypothetical protein
MKTLKDIFEGFDPSEESHTFTTNMDKKLKEFTLKLMIADDKYVAKVNEELNLLWQYQAIIKRAEFWGLKIDPKVFILLMMVSNAGIGGLLLSIIYMVWYDKRKSLCYSNANYKKGDFDIELKEVLTNLGPILLTDHDIDRLWEWQKYFGDNLIDNTEQVQEIIKYSRELMK